MASRAQLVDDLPHFDRLIHFFAARLPAHLREECVSEAQVAMVEAADAWQPGAGITFRAFVTTRVQHRMIDEARRFGHLQRDTGRSADGPSLDAPLEDMQDGVAVTRADLLEADGGDPHEIAAALERLVVLGKLPERWRIALTASSLADGAAQLGVTEDRVKQLRRKAREVIAGVSVAPPVMLSPAPACPAESVAVVPLSDRELVVLHRVALGETNAEIGLVLFIGTETVKMHVAHLIAKLDARNRTHAVAIAYEAEWWDEAA